MNVLYTCDNNYVWLMGISVISLFENNKNIDKLDVYLLGERISEENKSTLSKIGEKYGREIIIVDFPKIDIPQSLISARWPLSAFTRLYSGRLLPIHLNRVLYLDCDTIIQGDVSELDFLDIDDKVVYGVKDCIGKLYKENIGIDSQGVYVNAGVLLFNLIELRKIDIKYTIDTYMKKYERFINYADQDILNGIFFNRIGTLEPKYDLMTIDVAHCYEDIIKLRKPTNFYSKEEIEAAVNDPVIIHYTTNMRIVRPWYANTNHPFAVEFKKYMEISPWNRRRLQDLVFTSKEAKVIGILEKLPKTVAFRILGLIHSTLKPKYIRLKARLLKE